MEAFDAGQMVTDAIASLQGDITAVLPIALGVSVAIFGATFLWGKSRKVVSS